MGEDILRRRGRLYYDRGETLLRSRGDFFMGETISHVTPVHVCCRLYQDNSVGLDRRSCLRALKCACHSSRCSHSSLLSAAAALVVVIV